jgi:hypothetical protein
MRILTLAVLFLLLLGTHNQSAFGAPIFYTLNPTTNSSDWATAVTNLGGAINANVNFDAHPIGALQNAFYSGSQGVTFSTTGTFLGVQNTAGPGQANTAGSQIGEGVHGVSNTLVTDQVNTTLVVSFAQPVLGAGLFTVDFFNDNTTMFLEAYDGPNATGKLLGVGSAVGQNFQRNRLYFLGVSDSTNSIQSIRLIHNGDPTNDSIGIDDIQFAVQSQEVPEPVSFVVWSVLTMAGGLATRCMRKRKE